MTSTSLRRRILDRAVKPYAVALTVVTFAVALWGASKPIGFAGQVVAVIGFISAALLLAGWVARKESWMIHGLWLSAGVWAGVGAALISVVGIWHISTVSAFCWAIASGGAWLLEVEDAR